MDLFTLLPEEVSFRNFDPSLLPDPRYNYFLLTGSLTVVDIRTIPVDEQDKEKADRIMNQEAKDNFIFRRYILRRLLSFYRLKFGNMTMQYNNSGKPFLIPDYFSFNVSHSGKYSGILLGPQSLGFDMEIIRSKKDFTSLIEMHFNDNEKARLHSENLDHTFTEIWTKKEALLKALGTGLHDRLNETDTTQRFSEGFYIKSAMWNDTVISIATKDQQNNVRFFSFSQ